MHFSGNGMTLIVHPGKERTPVPPGITDVDHAAVLNCTSAAGCIVVGEASAQFYHAYATLCAYIDGNPPRPPVPVFQYFSHACSDCRRFIISEEADELHSCTEP